MHAGIARWHAHDGRVACAWQPGMSACWHVELSATLRCARACSHVCASVPLSPASKRSATVDFSVAGAYHSLARRRRRHRATCPAASPFLLRLPPAIPCSLEARRRRGASRGKRQFWPSARGDDRRRVGVGGAHARWIARRARAASTLCTPCLSSSHRQHRGRDPLLALGLTVPSTDALIGRRVVRSGGRGPRSAFSRRQRPPRTFAPATSDVPSAPATSRARERSRLSGGGMPSSARALWGITTTWRLDAAIAVGLEMRTARGAPALVDDRRSSVGSSASFERGPQCRERIGALRD